jgi:hypothetical protein
MFLVQIYRLSPLACLKQEVTSENMNSFLLHVRFKPTIPVFKQSKTAHAVDCTATVTALDPNISMCATSHCGDTHHCTVSKQTKEIKHDKCTIRSYTLEYPLNVSQILVLLHCIFLCNSSPIIQTTNSSPIIQTPNSLHLKNPQLAVQLHWPLSQH